MGGSSGSADGPKFEEVWDWHGNVVLEEVEEQVEEQVEEPPPLPPPPDVLEKVEEQVEEQVEAAAPLLEDEVFVLAKPEDPPLPAEASPVEVSKGQEVMQRIAEAPERLETEAYRALEAEFIAVAKPEDLRSEDRESYEAVRGTGVGLCARCRWMSGCQSCDEEKAWGFACRSTLWHTAHEDLRPKARPRGRPKKAA